MNAGFPLPIESVVTEDHMVQVCRYRQGSSCCKYLVFFNNPHNFYCVKKYPELNKQISSLDLLAKGDNCEGLPQ